MGPLQAQILTHLEAAMWLLQQLEATATIGASPSSSLINGFRLVPGFWFCVRKTKHVPRVLGVALQRCLRVGQTNARRALQPQSAN